MMDSRIASLIVAVLMTASLLHVAAGVSGFDGSVVPSSIDEHTEDGDGDGKFNFLVVTVPVDLYEVLEYENVDVRGELRNSAGTILIDTDTVVLDVEEGDTGMVYADLRFSGRTINASGIDGPYLVEIDLRYDDGSFWPPVFSVYDSASYDTDAYTHDEFETPDPYTITDVSWRTVDDDDDGLFDWLEANLTVDADDGDEVTCETSWGTRATTVTDHVLAAGPDQTVTVLLDGRLVNGFAMEDYIWDIGASLSTSDGYSDWDSVSTDPLSSSDFENYTVQIVGDIDWEALDVNDDGLVDFVKLQYNVTVETTARYSITTEVEDGNGSAVSWPDGFEGFLVSGYEETMITFIDADPIYESREAGPYYVTVQELPDESDLWPEYTYIFGIVLGELTLDELDLDAMNHPASLSVSGFVLDESEAPISGATVEGMSLDLDWLWDSYDDDATMANGSYELSDIAPGYLRVVASAPGCFPQMVVVDDFSENITNLNITLESRTPENSTIVGTVTNLEGDPVAGATVVIIRSGSGMVNGTGTDSEGNYTIDVKPGDYGLFGIYFDPVTDAVNLTYVPVSAPQNDTVEQNLTLDLSISDDGDMTASGLIELVFDDWNNADMNWRIEFSPETVEMLTEYFLMMDLEYGNADGYLSESEARILEAEFFGEGFPLHSGTYSLDMFSVDGVGYFVPPEGIDVTMSDVTGPVLEPRDEFAFNVAFTGGYAYWTIPDADSHDVYLGLDYRSTGTDDIDLVFEMTAPAGFVLTDADIPENISVEGVSHVVVTPGESPDPENVETALVVLTFTRETSAGTGAIRGFATLQDGEDHSGILVELLDDGLVVLDSVTTGSTGEYAFPNLEPGDYQLRANMSGYIDAYASVTAVEGEVAEVNIELLPVGSAVEPGSMEGRVVTEAGLPIEGATVELYMPSDGDTASESATTDPAGEFHFADLEPGEYRLEVSADGFSDSTMYVLLNSGEEKDLGDMELVSESPVGYVTGTLEDADGEPIEGVLVEVRASGSEEVLGEGETDSDGRFLIDGLEDGDYNLTFVLDGETIGYADVTVDDFVGDAGTITIDLDSGGIELPSWLWIALILALVVVVAVAVALKMRKPKEPGPMKMAEQTPEEELDIPPPPPE